MNSICKYFWTNVKDSLRPSLRISFTFVKKYLHMLFIELNDSKNKCFQSNLSYTMRSKAYILVFYSTSFEHFFSICFRNVFLIWNQSDLAALRSWSIKWS